TATASSAKHAAVSGAATAAFVTRQQTIQHPMNCLQNADRPQAAAPRTTIVVAIGPDWHRAAAGPIRRPHIVSPAIPCGLNNGRRAGSVVLSLRDGWQCQQGGDKRDDADPHLIPSLVQRAAAHRVCLMSGPWNS